MSNFISASELNSNDWLAVVTCDGIDGMGAVLGFVIGDTEQQVNNIPRGEMCDWLELFMGEDIPDDVSVEYTTVQDFYDCYEDRMPLGHNGIRI
jgi:hypothetical protein